MALTTYSAFFTAFPSIVGQVQTVALVAKGIGANNFYYVEVDPATGKLPVDAALASTLDFGAAADALRVAALVGNATGIADFNSGAAGAQTLRTVLCTRHEAAATPVSVRLSDGSGFVSPTAPPAGRSVAWLKRLDMSSTNVGAAAYVELVAATSAAISRLRVFFSGNSGDGLILATGAAGAEVEQLYIPPGGSDTDYELTIANGARVAVKSLNGTNNTGLILITALT